MSQRPVMYLQYDSRWGNIPWSNHNDPKQTIASSGCGVTSMAMVLATFLNDLTIRPDYTAKLALDNGYRTYDLGTDFAFFPFCAEKFGLELVQSQKVEDAVWALQHGGLVICSMTKGYFTASGHFILAYAVQGDQILVNEPAHPTRDRASIDLFRQQCQRYFIFYKKEAQPMDWEAILAAVSQQADDWKKGINAIVEMVKADSNLGDVEILQYLPELFEKIYQAGQNSK